MVEIIVPKGIVAVHSLDLWGPVVDATVLGKRKLDAYKQLAADKEFDPEASARIAADYEALLNGEAWAMGDRKRDIIKALEDPIYQAGRTLDYNGVFQQDGLSAMREILGAGDGFVIFTSGSADWLKKQLPEDITSKMGDIHVGKKTDPEAFKKVYSAEAAMNRHVVSHTADETPELEAAVKSGLFKPEGLVFIARNGKVTPEQVQAMGVGRYVTDMRQVGYASLARKI